MDTIRPYTYMTCAKRVPHFCDESMTPLFKATFEEFNPEARRGLLQKLHAKTMEVLPALFLVEQVDVTGVAASVSGLSYINRSVNYDAVTISR
jgi:ABC-type transport system substrate-binding protein